MPCANCAVVAEELLLIDLLSEMCAMLIAGDLLPHMVTN